MTHLNALFGLLFVVLAGASTGKPGERIDFVYHEGERLADIEVPFAVSAQCSEAGVSLFSSGAVQIEEVWADGRRRPSFNGERFVDDAATVTIRRPGPGFQYRKSLDRLERVDPDGHRSVYFPFDEKEPLPQRIVVIYRIRCADGKVGEKMNTTGVKLVMPQSRQCVLEMSADDAKARCK